MRRHLLGAPVVALMIVAAACGGDDDDSFLNAGTVDAGSATVDASGVVLVHGASLPSLRLCFEADLSRLPMPSDVLLPNANIVGLATGGAVRVSDIPLGAGHVFAYESTIDLLSPTGSTGPTCKALGDMAASLRSYDLGVLPAIPDAGVTLLAISGAAGELALSAIPITAWARPSSGALPVQFLSLSPAFTALAAGHDVSVAFGALDGGMAPFFDGEIEAGVLIPSTPLAVSYSASDIAVYAEQGFRISIGTRVVLEETLADIVTRSSPRDVPTSWLDGAASYVLVLLGDPAADAGPTQLHFVAVPSAR